MRSTLGQAGLARRVGAVLALMVGVGVSGATIAVATPAVVNPSPSRTVVAAPVRAAAVAPEPVRTIKGDLLALDPLGKVTVLHNATVKLVCIPRYAHLRTPACPSFLRVTVPGTDGGDRTVAKRNADELGPELSYPPTPEPTVLPLQLSLRTDVHATLPGAVLVVHGRRYNEPRKKEPSGTDIWFLVQLRNLDYEGTLVPIFSYEPMTARPSMEEDDGGRVPGGMVRSTTTVRMLQTESPSHFFDLEEQHQTKTWGKEPSRPIRTNSISSVLTFSGEGYGQPAGPSWPRVPAAMDPRDCVGGPLLCPDKSKAPVSPPVPLPPT